MFITLDSDDRGRVILLDFLIEPSNKRHRISKIFKNSRTWLLLLVAIRFNEVPVIMSFDGALLNASHCSYYLIFAYLCIYIILNMEFIVNIHLIKVIATFKASQNSSIRPH
jgi:hypothetical protein